MPPPPDNTMMPNPLPRLAILRVMVSFLNSVLMIKPKDLNVGHVGYAITSNRNRVLSIYVLSILLSIYVLSIYDGKLFCCFPH